VEISTAEISLHSNHACQKTGSVGLPKSRRIGISLIRKK